MNMHPKSVWWSVCNGLCMCELNHTCAKCHIRVRSEATHNDSRLMLNTIKLQETQKSTYTTLGQKLVKNLT